MNEKNNIANPILSFEVERTSVLPINHEPASDSQGEDSSRKMTMFALEALRRKKAMSTKPSSRWILSFPVALLIWPFVRLIYSSHLNVGVVVALNSLIIFLCMSLRVFPTIFCVYFYIFYVTSVWIEFDVFRRQPRGEGFVKSIRDTISYMETIMPLEMFGKRRKVKFTIAMIIPLMVLAGCLTDSPFDISALDSIRQIKSTENVSFYYDEWFYICRSLLDSDDFSGGFHSNPWLYSAGCFSLLIIALLKGYEIGIFYRTINFQLQGINRYVDSFISSYDITQVEEMSIYFKNRRESWIERTKLFRIMDFNQTLSLTIPILSLCLLLFVGDREHFLAGYWNRFLPSAVDIDYFRINVELHIFFCIVMYIWKLTRCFAITTHTKIVDTRLTDVHQELAFIQEFPQIFIRIIKKDQIVVPAPKDIVRWSDIVINQRINDELLDKDHSLIKVLLKALERNEAAEELTFREVCDLITRDAKTTTTAFNRLKMEYDKLFSVVEYKLMGLIPLNKKTVSTVIVGLGSALVSIVVRSIQQIITNGKQGNN